MIIHLQTFQDMENSIVVFLRIIFVPRSFHFIPPITQVVFIVSQILDKIVFLLWIGYLNLA